MLERWRNKLFLFDLFLIDIEGVGRCYRSDGRIWRDWEVGRIGVRDAKFLKDQQRIMFFLFFFIIKL